MYQVAAAAADRAGGTAAGPIFLLLLHNWRGSRWLTGGPARLHCKMHVNGQCNRAKTHQKQSDNDLCNSGLKQMQADLSGADASVTASR